MAENPLVRGAQPRETGDPPVYDVIRLARGEHAEVTVLSEYIRGVECHWVVDPATKKGATRRCYREEGDCRQCGLSRELWQGYLAVIRWPRKVREVLCLGRESARLLAEWVAPSRVLRGQQLIVSRGSAAPTAAYGYAWGESRWQGVLPSAHRMDPTLCMILRCGALPECDYSAKELREGQK